MVLSKTNDKKKVEIVKMIWGRRENLIKST